jgi:hypothetical protein
MDLEHLLVYEWGQGQLLDIDILPPIGFLELIAQRSGVALERLRLMTMSGWVPWLLDSLDPDPDSFDSYVHQMSVLFPHPKHQHRLIPRWRAWLPKQTLQRACPSCLNESVGHETFKLMWQFPLFISCPIHGCWLQSYIGNGQLSSWHQPDAALIREASGAIKTMDRRTEQALTCGQVDLPRRPVHAGIWFRLLRALIEELSMPIYISRLQSKDLARIWATCGHPVRAGQTRQYPFEMLDLTEQLQFLEASAVAMSMIENQEIKARGSLASLFWPEPDQIVDAGDPLPVLPEPTEKEIHYWQIAERSLAKTIDEARKNPVVAKALFTVLLFGRRDAKTMRTIRTHLSAFGIPAKWCHNKPNSYPL